MEELKAEAAARGQVAGAGVHAQGGPVPRFGPITYEDQPFLKPPVWTWEVPLYFFIGGLAGMSAVVAFAAQVAAGDLAVVRTALWLAVSGALASSVLLILDLGRPIRFLYMLRVFKLRSPMSVGAWTLVLFSAAVTLALVLFEAGPWNLDRKISLGALDSLLSLVLGFGAVFGAVLATYTGVLLGATAIPVWHRHRSLLPVHFGVVALGSAVAAVELAGHSRLALEALGGTAATFETGVLLWSVFRSRGGGGRPADRPLHRGPSGRLLSFGGVLLGPLALGLRLSGLVPAAALAFLAGAVLVRYGWVAAGRASALTA